MKEASHTNTAQSHLCEATAVAKFSEMESTAVTARGVSADRAQGPSSTRRQERCGWRKLAMSMPLPAHLNLAKLAKFM